MNSTQELPTEALYISGLSQYTTDAELARICKEIGQTDCIRNINFLEHRINAKSRGVAYIEFSSLEPCIAVKSHIEDGLTSLIDNKKVSLHYASKDVIGAGAGAGGPFKVPPRDSSGRPVPLPTGQSIPQYHNNNNNNNGQQQYAHQRPQKQHYHRT